MNPDSTFDLFGTNASTMLTVLVFLASATLAFAVMLGVRAREAVRRRTARVNIDVDESDSRRSLRFSGARAAQRLIEYTTKHYSSVDNDNVKMLRRRLMQAGIYSPHGAAYFFIARGLGAVTLGFAAFLVLPMIGFGGKATFWLFVMAGGLFGYLAPSFYLDRLTKKKQLEHQSGFPDLMDLLVVCADAGSSMEASLDRVGRELVDSYPSLAANIHMANLEIRAGRTMTEALESLGDRPGFRGWPYGYWRRATDRNRTNSAPASGMRCASIAMTCAIKGCHVPRRRPTPCR